MRDIVIVGGGPAGTTAAIALAHRAPELASRIALLERARYPRDKPCAGAIGGRGDAVLRSVGVTIDVPSAPIDGVSLRCRAGEAIAAPGGIGRVVRRVEFDHALALAARARGVEVREAVRVLRVRDDPLGGAIVETTEGTQWASVVLGCDGVGSVVRRSLGMGAGGLRAQVVEVDTETARGDRDRRLIHVDVTGPWATGYAWDFPTVVGGRPLVCRGVYRLLVDGASVERRMDIGAMLDSRLRQLGIDPSACSKKRYAERGYEPASRLGRGATMLVGEAAGIDPATGEGIAQSIEYGVLAAQFLAPRLLARPGLPVVVDDWTACFSRSRLARDLRIRTRIIRLFFGPHRSHLERLMTRSPDILHIGCLHFAGRPREWADWGKVGKVAVRAFSELTGAVLARV
jgi:menaquinone-9 beta-reductase